VTIAGRSIVVCRASHQAAPLLDRLTALGAAAVHVPLIEVAAPQDGGAELLRLVDAVSGDGWLAFTSANGVDSVGLVLDGRVPQGRIAVVGGATAERAQALGWPVDFVAPVATAAGLGASLPAGEPVLAVLAELASSDLVDGLELRGIEVEAVTGYRTVMPDVSSVDLQRVLQSDAALVTAPSVVQRLTTLVDPTLLPPLVAIGPTSAAAIVSLGLDVADQASEPTVDGLIAAVMRTLGP